MLLPAAVLAQTVVTPSQDAPLYRNGDVLTLSCQFAYPEERALWSLLWKPRLPEGWTLLSASGDDVPFVDASTGEIIFFGALNNNPVEFSYTVQVPESASGQYDIGADIEYLLAGMVNAATVVPEALIVSDASASHDAVGYLADTTLSVGCTFSRGPGRQLLSLLWRPVLPAGWTLSGASGDGTPFLDWDGASLVFLGDLSGNPLAFTLTVSVPAGTTLPQEIGSVIEYQLDGMVNPLELAAEPDPLILHPMHTLAVVSAYGDADPAVGLYTNRYGVVLSPSVTAAVTNGLRVIACTGWDLDGNDPASGPATSFSMTVEHNAVLTWNWAAPLVTEPVGGSVDVTMDEDGAAVAWAAPTVTADAVAYPATSDAGTLTWSPVTAPANGSAQVSGTGPSPTTLEYVPNADWNGNDSFVINVENGLGGSETVTIHVVVNPVNDPPNIVQGATLTLDTAEDTAVDVLVNASDVENDPLSWIVSGPAAHGNVTGAGDGAQRTFSYTPADDFYGSDSFVLEVSDGQGGTDTIRIDVSVSPRNDPPVNMAAPSVTGTHRVGTQLSASPGDWNDTIDTLYGDYSAIGYAYQWERSEDGGDTWMPISGAESATYTLTVDDAHRHMRVKVTATDDGVGIPVTQSAVAYSPGVAVENTPPEISGDDARSMDEDGVPVAFVGVELTAVDADNDTLTWSFGDPPAHGSAGGASGSGGSKTITYVPDANWNGIDYIRVRIADGRGGEDEHVMTVTVNPRNDMPVNAAVPTVAGIRRAGQELTASPGDWNDITDTDVNGASTIGFAYQWQRSADGEDPWADIAGAGLATYTLTVDDAHQHVRVQVTATDSGVGLPAEQSAVADSEGALTENTPPVLTLPIDLPAEIPEMVAWSFSAGAADADGDALEFTLEGEPNGATIDRDTGAFFWTPDEEQGPGLYEFDVAVTDGRGAQPELWAESFESLDVGTQVGGIDRWTGDDAVVVDDPSGPAAEGYAGNLPLPDPHTKTLKVAAELALAVDSETNTSIDFMIKPERCGETPELAAGSQVGLAFDSQGDLLLYHSQPDGENGWEPVWTTVMLDPKLDENAWVRITLTMDYETVHASGLPLFSIALNQTPVPNGDDIWFVGAVASTKLTSLGTTGPCMLDDVVVIAQPSSGDASRDVQRVTVTVAEVNRAPTLANVPTVATIPEMVAWSFQATATDPDILAGGTTNALSFSLLGEPSGAWIDPSSGVFTWEPSEAQGFDVHSFHVVVTDNGTPARACTNDMAVTVVEVNNPPVSGADAYTIIKGGTLTMAAPGVLGNDSDVDIPANPLTVELVSGPSAAASFTLNEDGSFAYTHDNGESSSDSFSYRVWDGTDFGDPVVVSLTVKPVHNIDLNTYHTTISEALEKAAASNQIAVADGTYSENLTLLQSVTVSASGVGYTVAGDVTFSAQPVTVTGATLGEGKLWMVTDNGSIQDAVDAASASNTIHVLAGSYTEYVTIDKPLTLTGAGSDLTGTILSSPMTEAGRANLFLEGRHALVDGIEIGGIRFQGDAVYDEQELQRGLRAYANSIEPGWESVGFRNLYIHDCAFDGTEEGVVVRGNLENVRIESNLFERITSYCAIATSTGYWPASQSRAWVIDGLSITGNEIRDSHCLPIRSSNYRAAYGARMVNVTISENYVHDNDGAVGEGTREAWMGAIATRWGIDSLTIADNVISNNAGMAGISITGDDPAHNSLYADLTLTGNVIAGCSGSEQGVEDVVNYPAPALSMRDLTSLPGLTLSGNSFEDADSVAVNVFNTPDPINCALNWLGSSNAVDVAAAVSAGVDYSPWLASDNDTELAVAGLQADYAALWVDSVSPVSGVASQVVEAISLIPAGGVINLSSGVYAQAGQVVMDKDLSLVGVDRDGVTFRPTQDTGNSGDARGWFLVQPGVTFVMTDATLDGDGFLVYQGVRHRGQGAFERVTFRNMLYPPYNGVAVAAFGDGAVDFTDCLFENIGRVGVLYYGPGVAGSEFVGNTYVGKGEGDWLDYALDISAGAQVTVVNNVVTGCEGIASSDGSSSAAVLVSTYFGGGTEATITGNTFTGNSTGIFVGYDATDTSVALIQGNDLSGNDYGVSASIAVTADANYWGHEDGPFGDDSQAGDEVAVGTWYADQPMTELRGLAVTDDLATTDEDVAVVIDVLGNDHDADGDALITTVTQGAHGSVAIAMDGKSVTYTPDANFWGTDPFTYTATDGAEVRTAGVTVEVLSVADDPVVVSFIGSSTDGTPTVLPLSGDKVYVACTTAIDKGGVVTDALAGRRLGDIAEIEIACQGAKPPYINTYIQWTVGNQTGFANVSLGGFDAAVWESSGHTRAIYRPAEGLIRTYGWAQAPFTMNTAYTMDELQDAVVVSWEQAKALYGITEEMDFGCFGIGYGETGGSYVGQSFILEHVVITDVYDMEFVSDITSYQACGEWRPTFNADGSCDTVDLDGALLNMLNVNLAIQPNGVPAVGASAAMVSGGTVTNTFMNVADGGTVKVGSVRYRVDYEDTAINLTVVAHEPQTAECDAIGTDGGAPNVWPVDGGRVQFGPLAAGQKASLFSDALAGRTLGDLEQVFIDCAAGPAGSPEPWLNLFVKLTNETVTTYANMAVVGGAAGFDRTLWNASGGTEAVYTFAECSFRTYGWVINPDAGTLELSSTYTSAEIASAEIVSASEFLTLYPDAPQGMPGFAVGYGDSAANYENASMVISALRITGMDQAIYESTLRSIYASGTYPPTLGTTVDLAGTTLILSDAVTLSVDTLGGAALFTDYPLLTGGTIVGTFNGLADGGVFTTGTERMRAAYSGTDFTLSGLYPTTGIDLAVTEDTPTVLDVGSGRVAVVSTPPQHGMAVVGPDQVVTYTPAEDYYGADAMTLTVSDGAGHHDQPTVHVGVAAVNDAPRIGDTVADAAAIEDVPFSKQVPETAFYEVDLEDVLTWSASGYPDGWLIFEPATRTFSGTPREGDDGLYTVTVSVTDGQGGAASQEFTLSIDAVNDAPTVNTPIADDTATEDEPYSRVIDAQAFHDVDAGDLLSWSASGLPGWLSFEAATRALSGTPREGDDGVSTITIRVTDTGGESAEQQFDLTVLAVNDAPVIGSIVPDGYATEDIAFSMTIDAGAFTDVDAGDSMTWSVSGLPVWLSFDPLTRTLAGTPVEGDDGVVPLVVKVVDGGGLSATQSFDLTVAAVEDAPVVQDLELITDEDTPVLGQIVASDPEGTPLSYVLIQAPAVGSASVGANGEVLYVPALDWSGTAVMQVQITDGAGLSAVVVVTVTVRAVDDPLRLLVTLTRLTLEEWGGNLANHIYAPDGRSVTFTQAGDAARGDVIVLASGEIAYTRDAEFTAGVDYVAVTACDGVSTAHLMVKVVVTDDGGQPVPVAETRISASRMVTLNGTESGIELTVQSAGWPVLQSCTDLLIGDWTDVSTMEPELPRVTAVNGADGVYTVTLLLDDQPTRFFRIRTSNGL